MPNFQVNPWLLVSREKSVTVTHLLEFLHHKFSLCGRETCNAKIIRENRKEKRLGSISCMRKVVSVASLA